MVINIITALTPKVTLTNCQCTCLQLWKPVLFFKCIFSLKLACKPCFCHTFFLTNQIEGNYDTLQFCFASLPISLASCVVLGFCPFHVILGALNSRGAYFVLGPKAVWVFKWSPGLRAVPRRYLRKLPNVLVCLLLMTTANAGVDFQ